MMLTLLVLIGKNKQKSLKVVKLKDDDTMCDVMYDNRCVCNVVRDVVCDVECDVEYDVVRDIVLDVVNHVMFDVELLLRWYEGY